MKNLEKVQEIINDWSNESKNQWENNWTNELTEAQKKEIKKEVKEALKEQDNHDNIHDKIYKKNLSWEYKISDFFNSIEFLWMDDIKKGEVAVKIKEDSEGDRLYWILIFLSSIIAALWLLQNSAAVVIWAMLIAPLLKPINWLSFSIARWWWKFFINALKVLVISIVISVLMWYLTTKLVWLNIETTEILSRSKPNIIDFFIASFSAVVAILSLKFERLWESIAWVAMAASLMPPLAVIGIELAIWNYWASFWATTLFWANLFAILFVATIFFWFYWFTPHLEKLQKNMFKRFTFMLVWIIIILIPLISSFLSIKNELKIQEIVRTCLTLELSANLSYFNISDLNIVNISKDSITLDSTIKILENADITKTLENINFELSKELNKEVETNFEIIRMFNINSEDEIYPKG